LKSNLFNLYFGDFSSTVDGGNNGVENASGGSD
jgi:hypothetical protein